MQLTRDEIVHLAAMARLGYNDHIAIGFDDHIDRLSEFARLVIEFLEERGNQ